MAKLQIRIIGNPSTQQNVRGLSFSAFVLSILIYISLFYVFNFSPNTLFKNTKFWFLISNALIIIIAVDSGAFSSSNEDYDNSYDEPLIISRPQEVAQNEEIVHTLQKNKQVDRSDGNDEVQAKREIQIVIKSDTMKHGALSKEKALQLIEKACDASFDTNKEEQETCHEHDLSKFKINEDHKIKLCLLETERIENDVDEEDKYSDMSDEELNRRVEEFIQNFNMQIRLQEIQNFGES
ncbi:Protein of unknown function DUF761, plant [Dillenia turbinata]|uniref:Uncharacterized protein n=1 Tax=Dillenia turbinata TaxID=194707 RepID=A0AAN8UKI1_9MAGN